MKVSVNPHSRYRRIHRSCNNFIGNLPWQIATRQMFTIASSERWIYYTVNNIFAQQMGFEVKFSTPYVCGENIHSYNLPI